jgi:hypothetical protein
VAAKNITVEVSVPVLDFSLPAWNLPPRGWQPQSTINRIASESAFSMDIVPLGPPIPSEYSSYDLQFFGPTVQCLTANSTQQEVFDNITAMFEAQDSVFTFAQVDDTYWEESLAAGSLVRLLYSGLAPRMAANTPGYWLPNCPAHQAPCPWQSLSGLWLQTSNSSIVCNSVNASFDVTIASVAGIQQITQRSITVLGGYSTFPVQQQVETIEDPQNSTASTQNVTIDWSPYFSHFYALAGLLIGNVSLSGTVFSEDGDIPMFSSADNYLKNDSTSNLLATGLIACDEIQKNPFRDFSIPSLGNQSETFSDTFPAETWMCRNNSLVQAIEDLSNNITISFLSSPDLADNTVLRNITTSNTINVYEYHQLYLLLSYGTGLLFASVTAAIGFYSLYVNGVSHSTSFSAIIATTRNSDLDSLTKGASLGAEPMKMGVDKTRLRFGPLINTNDGEDSRRKAESNGAFQVAPHIAFGFEETVGYLQKGAPYV